MSPMLSVRPYFWSFVPPVRQEILVVFEMFIELVGHEPVLCEKGSKSARGWYCAIDSSFPQPCPFRHNCGIFCLWDSAPAQDEMGIVELNRFVPFAQDGW